MKVPLAKRGACTARTLESLRADHHRFLTVGGGRLKVAKNYNNVIESYFFDIPLENVYTVPQLQ